MKEKSPVVTVQEMCEVPVTLRPVNRFVVSRTWLTWPPPDQVMLMSTGGTVIRMSVDDIKRSGRSTQGVIVMRLREGEHVSSLAPVVESADDKADAVAESNGTGPAEA